MPRKKVGAAIALVVLGVSVLLVVDHPRSQEASTTTTLRGTAESGTLLPPGQITTTPDVTTSSCHGGQGVVLPVVVSKNPGVGVLALTTGVTLVAVSRSKEPPVILALTSDCELQSSFGKGGTAQFSAPATSVPTTLSIRLGTPTNHGGALLIADSNGYKYVGELESNGTLNSSFGSKGWATVKYTGDIGDAVQLTTGSIILAGTSSNGGASSQYAVLKMNATGSLDPSFGTAGTTRVPGMLDTSGIQDMVVLPSGNIVLAVTGGLMGYYPIELAMVTASGTLTAGFGSNYKTAQMAGREAAEFTGGVFVRGAGFELVGTGQDHPFLTTVTPNATGVVNVFTPSGSVTAGFGKGGTATFPSTDFRGQYVTDGDGIVLGFGHPDTTFNSQTTPGVVDVRAITTSGPFDSAFGNSGTAQVDIPWTGTPTTTRRTWEVSGANGAASFVASLGGSAGIEMIRIRD